MQPPAVPYDTAGTKAGVFDGVTRYHWLVVIIASCGWLFDCMDQRLFILARESAMKELLGSATLAAGCDQDAHRLRDHVDDSRLGDRRDHLRHDERPLGRVKTMVATLLVYSGFTGLSGLCADVGGLHDLPVPRRARRRRDVRRGHDARRRKRPGARCAVALGALQALSALGNIIGSLISLQIQPGAHELALGLLRLARAVLRRHPAVAAGRPDRLRPQGTGIVAEAAKAEAGARRRAQERRIAD